MRGRSYRSDTLVIPPIPLRISIWQAPSSLYAPGLADPGRESYLGLFTFIQSNVELAGSAPRKEAAHVSLVSRRAWTVLGTRS